MRAAVALLLLFVAAAGARAADRQRALDDAFLKLDGAYPRTRYLEGGASMISGAITGFGGFALFLDKTRGDDEALVGLAASGLGAVVGIDGLIRFFGRSSAELVYPHYRDFMAGKQKVYGDRDKLTYGEEELTRLASDAKTARLLRGAFDLLSAGTHWYLWGKKSKSIYQYLIGPAIFLSATGLYRLFFPSPEERALGAYREAAGLKTAAATTELELTAVPSPEGGWLVARLVF